MRGIIVLTVVFILQSAHHSQAQTGKEIQLITKEKKLIATAWKKFRKAVINNDTATLKSLSTDAIYCDNCYDNSEEEKELVSNLQQNHPEKWEKMMEDGISYVARDTFIRNDLPVFIQEELKENRENEYEIFADNGANTSLFTDPRIISLPAGYSPLIFNVVITIAPPTKEYDGMQGVYSFIKTPGGYLFCAYGTVP